MPHPAPLVVDLDGTLTATDTLVESVIALLRARPWMLLLLPWWLLKGRAGFKEAVARHVRLDVGRLPWRGDLLEWIRAERARGREIVLATAAHRSIAEAVAQTLGCFDRVLASDATTNLKGARKLEAIRAAVGERFVYAGDSRADLPIWRAAQAAVLAGAGAGLAAEVRAQGPVEREFPAAPVGPRDWLRAIRLHQWLKNLLLLVPVLTAFSFSDPGQYADLALAFLAFSLTASATYLGNDLWDLDNDRAHPRKCQRPFASARLPLWQGALVAPVLIALAFVLAAGVSAGFVAVLFLYLCLTSIYSLWLKERMLLDVLTLSVLYTLRILAGAVTTGLPVSAWLLAFSLFLFLSLALVKRCSELVSLARSGHQAPQGRDYRVEDLAVLWPLGVGSALAAVVVFGLFINAPETLARYGTPPLLWLVALGLIYWLARLWIVTARGQMHDDPVIHAVRDPVSRWTVLAMVLVLLMAHFLVLRPAS